MPRTKPLRTAALALAALGLLGSSATPGMAAYTPLTITNMYCVSNGQHTSGNGSATCQVWVTGGTGSYTYAWQPGPYSGSGWAVLIYCTLCDYNNVSVTVTDSAGSTDTAYTTFFCGEAP